MVEELQLLRPLLNVGHDDDTFENGPIKCVALHIVDSLHRGRSLIVVKQRQLSKSCTLVNELGKFYFVIQILVVGCSSVAVEQHFHAPFGKEEVLGTNVAVFDDLLICLELVKLHRVRQFQKIILIKILG